MSDIDRLLERLQELFEAVDTFDAPTRGTVLELLDGVDTLHRLALQEWAAALGAEAVAATRDAHPAVTWLLDAYDLGPGPPAETPVSLRSGPRREGEPPPPPSGPPGS